MKAIKVFIISLLIVSFCCCVRDEIILPGDISGFVRDADTEEPLKEASIILNPSTDSVVTGSEGKYLIKKVLPQNYEIIASHPIYYPVEREIEVIPAVTNIIDFEMQKAPAYSISEPFLDFGLDLTLKSFTISNIGTGVIGYSISTNRSWVSVSNNVGEVTSEVDTVNVLIDRTSISEDIDYGKVFIIVDYGQEYHPVEVLNVYVNGVADCEENYYRVVSIGTQTWMAENLNIGSMIKLNTSARPSDNGTIEKYCYDDWESNCDTYGGLYVWNELTKYFPPDSELVEVIQGLCPEGWHIPTVEDYEILADYLGGLEIAGAKLKDTTSLWLPSNFEATNESGYSALPAGRIFFSATPPAPMRFQSLGISAFFWTNQIIYPEPDEYPWYSAVALECWNESDEFFIVPGGPVDQAAHSVRCIKDE